MRESWETNVQSDSWWWAPLVGAQEVGPLVVNGWTLVCWINSNWFWIIGLMAGWLVGLMFGWLDFLMKGQMSCWFNGRLVGFLD